MQNVLHPSHVRLAGTPGKTLPSGETAVPGPAGQTFALHLHRLDVPTTEVHRAGQATDGTHATVVRTPTSEVNSAHVEQLSENPHDPVPQLAGATAPAGRQRDRVTSIVEGLGSLPGDTLHFGIAKVSTTSLARPLAATEADLESVSKGQSTGPVAEVSNAGVAQSDFRFLSSLRAQIILAPEIGSKDGVLNLSELVAEASTNAASFEAPGDDCVIPEQRSSRRWNHLETPEGLIASAVAPNQSNGRETMSETLGSDRPEMVEAVASQGLERLAMPLRTPGATREMDSPRNHIAEGNQQGATRRLDALGDSGPSIAVENASISSKNLMSDALTMKSAPPGFPPHASPLGIIADASASATVPTGSAQGEETGAPHSAQARPPVEASRTSEAGINAIAGPRVDQVNSSDMDDVQRSVSTNVSSGQFPSAAASRKNPELAQPGLTAVSPEVLTAGRLPAQPGVYTSLHEFGRQTDSPAKHILDALGSEGAALLSTDDVGDRLYSFTSIRRTSTLPGFSGDLDVSSLRADRASHDNLDALASNPQIAGRFNQPFEETALREQTIAVSRQPTFKTEPSMMERESVVAADMADTSATFRGVDKANRDPIDPATRPTTVATISWAAPALKAYQETEAPSLNNETATKAEAEAPWKDLIVRDLAPGVEGTGPRFAVQTTAAFNASSGSAASASIAGQSTAVQIAEASRGTSDGTLDIQLAPEELGRVKISFNSHETGLSVSIQAERPETVDLIRRHLNDLIRELRAQGLEPASVDVDSSRSENFQGSDSSMSGHSVPDGETVSQIDTPHATDHRGRRNQASDGLDLRL
ncbi:flagellar hook-length control protein FliK [Tropicimonas aquimaris]|uniref:Flagellar hook-length control protein FliK n=1 Tax=Tropicimonas aquimaris TaxID=914152 RepID=A0ABW3IQN8_9RHOB